MTNGGWILEYLDFDSLENHIDAARVPSAVPLRATTEEQAIAEAIFRWDKLTSRARIMWDHRSYPREPRLVFVVSAERTGLT